MSFIFPFWNKKLFNTNLKLFFSNLQKQCLFFLFFWNFTDSNAKSPLFLCFLWISSLLSVEKILKGPEKIWNGQFLLFSCKRTVSKSGGNPWQAEWMVLALGRYWVCSEKLANSEAGKEMNQESANSRCHVGDSVSQQTGEAGPQTHFKINFILSLI